MTRDQAVNIALTKMYVFKPMLGRPEIIEAVFCPEGLVDALVALGMLVLDGETLPEPPRSNKTEER